jgi:hypothetical protein
MKTFSQLVEELFLREAAMIAGGSKAASHVSKYLKPEQTKSLSYTMAKDSGGASKGEQVRVKKVVHDPSSDKYHAHITHSSGSGVVPLNHIMKPEGVGRAGKSAEGQEDTAVTHLHSQITDAVNSSGGSHIKVKHLGKTYNVAGARKVVSGDFKGRKPKADIILHDEHNKPQVYLSHKASAKATGAQNYEGLSGHTEHKQVQDFLGIVKALGVGKGDSYVRKFRPISKASKDLHKSVMFGSSHDSKTHGVHNVHSIEHGPVSLTSHKTHYTIGSDKSINNDSSFKHEDHPLEMTARFMTDRKDHGISNARIGIAKKGSRPSSVNI